MSAKSFGLGALAAWAIWALGGAVIFPAQARACSCVQMSPADALAASVAVFEAKVTAIAPGPAPPAFQARSLRVTLRVTRGWKGLDQEEVLTVHTAGNGALCGYAFEVGQSYLVYAHGELADLTVSLCSRTRPMADAEQDLKELGLGVVPVQPTATEAVAGPATQQPKVRQVVTPTSEQATTTRVARPPPGQGGCASCSVGAPREAAGAGLLLALGLLAARVARRARVPTGRV